MNAVEGRADEYWLGQWVDEYEVTSSEQALRVLDLPGPMSRLAELAGAAPTYRDPAEPIPDLSVAAGRGIDLSGYMACGAFECMQKAVDATFPNIFHYFDHIILEGTSPRWFLNCLRDWPKSRHSELHRDIAEDVAIILYLREIGAYKYSIFREKPQGFCSKHMNQYAKEYKVPAYRDSVALHSATERLSAEAKFDMKWRKGVWTFWVTHDFFSEPASSTIARGKKRPPKPEEMAETVINRFTGGSLADIVFANKIGAPLARVIDTKWIDSKEGGSSANEGDVALHLELPVIDGIAIRDLLMLREDEKPFFDKFRAALRKAIEAQIQQNASAAPQAVARSVIREYIEPTLADIDTRLKVNQKKLSRKIGASLAVGAAVTSAGLIGALPLLVDTGVVAMAASLPHIYQYFEDYGEKVELNDLYFLWKAKKVASSGHSTPLPNVCS